jgi:ribosomal protein S12 methylthiotransferase
MRQAADFATEISRQDTKLLPRVGMISLGCAKNLIDSEIMLGRLQRENFPLTANADEADVLIVNTCSFIDSAKEESIEAIFEANRRKGLRRSRREQKLIVAGCMAQRFRRELPEAMPEVDAFMGLDQIEDVARIVQDVWEGNGQRSYVTPRARYLPDWDTPRLRLTPPHYRYVKIAEGCNHPCSFCIIPQMRGRHRSRTIESVVREVESLVAEGTKEILLISQDTTYFGMDRWEGGAGPRAAVTTQRGDNLITLLRELDAIPGEFWIRLLYTHPAHWSRELIEALASTKKVARYVDMPLQHIHGEMLQLMRRETSEEWIVNLIRDMREGWPGVAIRTTFIVGFPGESNAHFQRLLDFIRETRFERLGIFEYSQEEGTRAAKMEPQVPARLRRRRWEEAMAVQQSISAEIQAAQVGRRLKVLVDKAGIARTEADAPGIDGVVHVPATLPVGEFCEVEITHSSDYDLLAKGARWHKVERAIAQ